MRLWKLFICILTCVSLSGDLSAQVSPFEKITIENGLSQGMIFDILQTRDGFLWIATKDGLNRYDGNNFKVYSNDPFQPFSIAENTIHTLFEDSRGRLWLGLETKGLDVFDPKTGLFHHFPLNFGGARLFDETPVNGILETPDGTIWITQSRGGLIRIPIPDAWKNGFPAEAELQSHAVPAVIPLPLRSDPISESLVRMKYLKSGDLLATSSRTQYVVNTNTLVFREYKEGLEDHNSLELQQSKEEDFWFHRVQDATGIHETRLLREGKMQNIPLPEEPLKWVRFLDGQAGHTWHSLNNKIWDLAPGVSIDYSKPDFVTDVWPNCMELDRTGNLWVGSNGYGLRKLNPVISKFHLGASGTSIRGLWAGAGHYFARDLFAISIYDPISGKLDAKSAFADAPERQIGVLFDPSGYTWLVAKIPETTNGVLLKYAPGNYAHAERRYDFTANITLYDPTLRTRDGKIWIATDDRRLACFDPVSEQFNFFNYAALFGNKTGSVLPTSLAEDGNGNIWAGTQSGLICFQPSKEGGAFSLITAERTKPDGLNSNAISCLLPDPENPEKNLWVGTKGGGINILNIAGRNFHHITTSDGLLNNVVYGILPGARKGEWWCSTNRGLAKLTLGSPLPEKALEGAAIPGLKITTFTAALGLQDNEFNTGAYCKTTQGELLFGGVNGLNRFYPQELREDSLAPPVYIVGVEINHQNADFGARGSPLKAPVTRLSTLTLGYNQNNLSFEFAVLDFTDPSKNRYRYRMDGLEKEWVELGNQRFAHFNHLPPGEYTLLVQGNNGESVWRDAMPLRIIIYPPWYRSWVAYACYFLLLAWGGWRAYRFQAARWKEQQQRGLEQKEMEQLKILEQMKANFFSNITHEFRTPLTLIIEPVRQVMSKLKEPELKENLRLAEGNSQKLLDLVNQLLDMAKLEGGRMTLDLRPGDMNEAIAEILKRFRPLAAKRGVTLNSLSLSPELPIFQYDAGKLELIVNNLLSNALKFTAPGDKVDVWTALSTHEDASGTIRVAQVGVRDTGAGIAEKDLDKIFDRFYQADSGTTGRSTGGTGIGLALSKELATLMGGGISVSSKAGEGAEFIAWLPLSLPNASPVDKPQALPEKIPVKTERHRSRQGEALALIVEDNAELRQFMKSAIGPDWQVEEAVDGVEGIKKAVELLPDVVISDVLMPKKDGFALCEALKTAELTAHIPIILLTAKTGMESKLEGLRHGADDYLTKPFNTAELLTRMENLVEQRRRIRLKHAEQLPALPHSGAAVGDLQEGLSKPDRDFLQRCYELLDLHLSDEDLGVEAFAQKLFVSRMQLHRKLKALVDQAPLDFIRSYRLEKAMKLLRDKAGNVSEVSRMVGFVNEKHFSTVFKERFGKSPSEI